MLKAVLPDSATNLHKFTIKNYAKPSKKVAISYEYLLTFSEISHKKAHRTVNKGRI
jgi:hypothetical protein